MLQTFADRPEIRIADMGISKSSPSILVCTLEYKAPEISLGLLSYLAADIWSFGCIIFEMWMKKKLFPIYEKDDYQREIGKFFLNLTKSCNYLKNC